MGITHKPIFHMTTDMTTDCILPFKWGLHINPFFIWTGQQTVYYPDHGDVHMDHMYWRTHCILPC